MHAFFSLEGVEWLVDGENRSLERVARIGEEDVGRIKLVHASGEILVWVLLDGGDEVSLAVGGLGPDDLADALGERPIDSSLR